MPELGEVIRRYGEHPLHLFRPEQSVSVNRIKKPFKLLVISHSFTVARIITVLTYRTRHRADFRCISLT